MRNRQRGNALVIVLATLGIVAAIAGALVIGVWSNAAYGNRTEARIDAVWEQNSNVYSSMASSIAEIANVAEESVLQQKEYITQALDARYGSNGSQALFQWLQEQNPALDIGVYKQLSTLIEAKRTEFQQSQKILVDVKRQYITALGNPLQGFFLNVAGYPKLNIGYPRGSEDDYAVIISSQTREVFETGEDVDLSPFKRD